MRYSFDAADAPTPRTRQYYCMLGTRGIWQEGWKAVAVHGPTSGIGHFDDDQWELFHVDEDRAEADDLAAEHPDKLKQLIEVWFEEAGKYDVLPLDDRHPWEIIADVRPQTEPDRDTYIYYPRHRRGARGRGAQHPRALVQAPRRGRDRERRRRGRDLRPGRALRRPRPVPQGPPGALRLQLPRRPARAALLLATSWRPVAT